MIKLSAFVFQRGSVIPLILKTIIMKFIVIFTWLHGSERYCVEVMASTREQALLIAVQNMVTDYRHFDTVQVSDILID